MKKNLIVLISIFFCVLSVNLKAQKLGFIGGPSMSYGTIYISDKSASFTMIPGGGMHAGMLFEMDVTNRWGIDAAVMYELRTMRWGISYNNDSISRSFKRQVGYLNVPFHFYVNFPVAKEQVFSLFAGPVFACGLHGSDWAWESAEPSLPEWGDKPLNKPVTDRLSDMFDKKGRLVRCEIAAEFGLAFKLHDLQGRISYQHTINNDNSNKYTFTLPLKDVNPYHTQGTVKLSVAYVFDLRK
jgi:hypothetical protein